MKQGKKVRPGLSLTGKMVRDRLQNKTLKPADGGGGYSVEDEVMRLNSMTRVEIARAYADTARNVLELQKKVNEQTAIEESRKTIRMIEERAKKMMEQKLKADASGGTQQSSKKDQ